MKIVIISDRKEDFWQKEIKGDAWGQQILGGIIPEKDCKIELRRRVLPSLPKGTVVCAHDTTKDELREFENEIPIIYFQHTPNNEVVKAIKDKDLEHFQRFLHDWYRIKIVSPLLPLHLSLQAFFGIGRDEQGKWVELIKVLPNEWSDGFPTKDAFLLVPEAEWDFYASIFNRTMPPSSFAHGMDGKYGRNSCEEEKEEYKKDKNLAILLENVEKDGALKNIGEAFRCPCGEENSDFVKSLREICAILANTKQDCKKHETYYGYKGKQEARKVRNDILRGMAINSDDDSQKHCKLEKNGKRNLYYERLEKQVEKWGIQRARIVIEGIEGLAGSLV